MHGNNKPKLANIAKHEYICLDFDAERWNAKPFVTLEFRSARPETGDRRISYRSWCMEVWHGNFGAQLPTVMIEVSLKLLREEKSFGPRGGRGKGIWLYRSIIRKCKFSLFGRAMLEQHPIQGSRDCLRGAAFKFSSKGTMKSNPFVETTAECGIRGITWQWHWHWQINSCKREFCYALPTNVQVLSSTIYTSEFVLNC